MFILAVITGMLTYFSIGAIIYKVHLNSILRKEMNTFKEFGYHERCKIEKILKEESIFDIKCGVDVISTLFSLIVWPLNLTCLFLWKIIELTFKNISNEMILKRVESEMKSQIFFQKEAEFFDGSKSLSPEMLEKRIIELNKLKEELEIDV